MEHDEIIAATRRWLERAVIGLDLCPFADSAYRGGRVRFQVSEQRSAAGLLEDLRDEFVRDFVFPALRANAVYEGEYLMGTSLARPIIAKGIGLDARIGTRWAQAAKRGFIPREAVMLREW